MTARHENPGDFGVALTMIRLLRGWGQVEIARASGLSVGTVSRYETGVRMPGRPMVDRIAGAAGLSERLVDGLLDWIRAARAEVEGKRAVPPVLPRISFPEIPEPGKEAKKDVNQTLDTLLSSFSRSFSGSGSGSSLWPTERERRAEPPTEDPEADRQAARELWGRLEPLDADDRVLLVSEGTEYQSWALSELVCDRCLEAVEQPREALELAELAVFIAERIEGRELWKRRLKGYATAHLGRAREAAGDLLGAAKAYIRAQRLWDGGASADPGVLNEKRVKKLVPDLDALQPRK